MNVQGTTCTLCVSYVCVCVSVCVTERQSFWRMVLNQLIQLGQISSLCIFVPGNLTIFPNCIIWSNKRMCLSYKPCFIRAVTIPFFLHPSFLNSWFASKANSYAVINLALQSCQHRGDLNDMKEWMWETELRNIQMIHWKLNEDLRIHLFINPETAVNKCVSVMIQRNNKTQPSIIRTDSNKSRRKMQWIVCCLYGINKWIIQTKMENRKWTDPSFYAWWGKN